MGINPYTTDEPQDSPSVVNAWRRLTADMHIRRHIVEGVMSLDEYLIKVKGYGGMQEDEFREIRDRVLREIEAEQEVRRMIVAGELSFDDYMRLYLSVPESRIEEFRENSRTALFAGCTD